MARNIELYHDPVAEAAALTAVADIVMGQTVRVWVSGFVATEPLGPRQIQPFANWGRSDLRYDVGVGPTPPPGYTGVTYEPTVSPYPPSKYIDHFDKPPAD